MTNRPKLPRSAPPMPPALPSPVDECLPDCDPYPTWFTQSRNDREQYPPVVIPGTSIIVDPRNPSRGRDEEWYAEEGRVELSEPVATVAPPQLFDPIAQTAPSAKQQWITVVEHEVPAGMHGLAVRYVTVTNTPGWSDVVEFALRVSGEIHGEPWVGNDEWPFPIPIARRATQRANVEIVARVRPQYWSANWPLGIIVTPTPLRSLITAQAYMEVYCVAMLPPTPADQLEG